MCIKPITVYPANKKIVVPCAKCLACLTNKRNEWSFRLMEEYKRSKSAAFITLTYHPKFVPDQGVDKKHFQKFMKRLRKKSGERLRYYAVGEYGTKTNRPHYHAIIFNYYGNENFLQSVWPFGIVHIGKVTEASIKYTTKYVIQRHDVPRNQNKPFSLMSRAFGLGLWYLTDEMVHWHREGSRNYTLLHGVKGRLPRYYKDKIWPDQEIRNKVSEKAKWEGIKANRKNLAIFYRLYGERAKQKQTEMRNAVVSRVKQKVAFTQTL